MIQRQASRSDGSVTLGSLLMRLIKSSKYGGLFPGLPNLFRRHVTNWRRSASTFSGLASNSGSISILTHRGPLIDTSI
uniref:Uncharacterized protein n=1 Tax=Arundo donax TaxID=35708 RepID=A0A0A8ZLK3_ARUDO